MPANPSTELLTLGKGALYLAEFSGGSPGTYRDLGNSPSVAVEIAIEVLDHFSSRSGSKEKDKQAVVQRGYKVNFDLDEKSKLNLALLTSGTLSGNTIQALTDAGTSKEFALRFVSDNPEGPNDRWEFWKGKIRARGEVSLIGEEWMTMPFVFDGLKDAVNQASSPWFNIYYSTTTTTTTSSTTTTTTAP